MSWGRIDDRMPEHPKWTALERQFGSKVWAEAMAVWSVVLCYANRNETDGAIEETLLARITPLGRGALKAADAMCEVRLMDRTEHGFRLHDFLAYNPSAEKKKADRLADAARKVTPKPATVPDGLRPDSERSPSGSVPDSAPPTRARGRARTPASRPVPSRPDPVGRGDLSRESSIDQVAGEPDSATTTRKAEALRSAASAAFAQRGIAAPRDCNNLDGAVWHELAKRLDEPALAAHGAALDVFTKMLAAFIDDPRAKAAGYPLGWVSARPAQYLSARVEPAADIARLLAGIPSTNPRTA